jgi:hypothetical protein
MPLEFRRSVGDPLLEKKTAEAGAFTVLSKPSVCLSAREIEVAIAFSSLALTPRLASSSFIAFGVSRTSDQLSLKRARVTSGPTLPHF